jgi:hypothetical protein
VKRRQQKRGAPTNTTEESTETAIKQEDKEKWESLYAQEKEKVADLYKQISPKILEQAEIWSQIQCRRAKQLGNICEALVQGQKFIHQALHLQPDPDQPDPDGGPALSSSLLLPPPPPEEGDWEADEQADEQFQ